MKFIDKTPKPSNEIPFGLVPVGTAFLAFGKVWTRKPMDNWGRNATLIGGGDHTYMGEHEHVTRVHITEVHYEVVKP